MGMVRTGRRRSEIVRERRNKRDRVKPASGKPKKKARRRTSAPTVVRAPSMAQKPGAGRAAAQIRKRRYIALPTVGAELRLPAFAAINPGWRLLSASISLALIASVYMLLSSATFQVGWIDTSGLERISTGEMNAVLGVYGASIFSIDPAAMVNRLQSSYPELVDIRVRAGFPAKVLVEAVERTPVLIWEQNGRATWVDRNGVAFKPRGEADGLIHVVASDTPDAPAGEDSPVSEQIIPAELVEAIEIVSTIAPAGTTLLYDPQHGLGWVDGRGWQVYFGPNPADMPARLSIYAAMIDMFAEKGIQPVFISLEHLHAPYYRLVAE